MQYTNKVFTNPNNGIPEDITRLYEAMTSKHDDLYFQTHARSYSVVASRAAARA